MAGHNENERRDFEDWASMNGILAPWSEDQTTVAYQVSQEHSLQKSARSRDESTRGVGSGVRRVTREPTAPRIPSLRAAQHRVADAEHAEYKTAIVARPRTLVGMQPSAALLGERSSLLERDARDEYASWLPRTPLFLSAAAFGVLGGLWFGHTTLDASARMPIGGSGAGVGVASAQLPFTAEPEPVDAEPSQAERSQHAQSSRVGSGSDSEPLAALAATSGAGKGKGTSERAKSRHEAMLQRREAAKAKREAAALARKEAKEERLQAARERKQALKEKHDAAASTRRERAEARKTAAAEKRAAAKAHREELAAARRESGKSRQEELAEKREAAKARREEAAQARREAKEEQREATKARREEAAEARRVALAEKEEKRRGREASDLDDNASADASGGAQGTLRINSRPWAQVFVDGRLVGYTPQVGFPVSAGRHSVRLVNPTFSMSKIFDVKVAAGERITRIETLEE